MATLLYFEKIQRNATQRKPRNVEKKTKSFHKIVNPLTPKNVRNLPIDCYSENFLKQTSARSVHNATRSTIASHFIREQLKTK